MWLNDVSRILRVLLLLLVAALAPLGSVCWP